MSRLIVKNIPNEITETQIQKIFEAKGEVTDVKIIFKGTQNRRFCFVGYKNQGDGQAAQKHFDNTFIHMSKVKVEFAKTADDPSLPRPWSKYTKPTIKEPQLKKKVLIQEKSQKFKEFLDLMKSNKNTQQMSWNDNVDLNITTDEKKVDDQVEKIFEPLPTLIKPPALGVNEKRLYVTNIPYTSTEGDLRQVFEKYGTVISLKIPKSRGGSLSGFCFVSYALPEEAMRAYMEMDNKVVLGRILHIKPAFEDDKQEQAQQQLEVEEKSSYKKYKKQQMLERLNDSTHWNTLFLNPNTIIEAIGEKYSLQKAEILAEENEDMAVKMAQMETQIIKETKDWLKSVGLNLDFLKVEKGECERSNKTIFVKNLQFRVTESDLHELFSRYGKISKLYLAPNKAIGIVCYDDQQQAENGFQNLSNYKFKGSILYLEWAPKSLIQEKEKIVNEVIEVEEQEELSRIIYVKNISFQTTEKALHKLFADKYPDLKKATIVRKEGVSQGYGFLEFGSNESAAKVIRQMNKVLLDEHALQLSQSKPKVREQQSKKQREELEATNKLAIRNLPFEATAEELKKLVRQYGELKKLRLPKKLDGSLRGFAFAEFINTEEAQNAMESLQNTHFYGRRLVIEFAKEE